jgi:hypothetical protein
MQLRAKTGTKFEKECEVDGWVVRAKKPKIKWSGKGRSNFDKIKSCNYDPSNFFLLECDLSKYDIYNPELNKYREVKSYYKKELTSWKLYSEPYFKVADKSTSKKIDVETYNSFIDKFWEYNKKTGLIEKIQEGLTAFNEGIQCKDGFIPKDELEFRTVVLNEWGGYKRITIQFKIK